MMNDQQLLRYSRQILLPEFDIAGQEKLLASTVLIVGLGGLGSPVALYLAAAGVGHLVLADFDSVDLSNLQRQIAHAEQQIGRNKAESAADAIAAINPGIHTRCLKTELSGNDLLTEVVKVDVVVDCSDNFATRHALNAACVKHQKPLISGAAIRFEGQVAVFDARNPKSPCYHCLYPTQDEQALSCSESGVISPLVGVIGSMQALEAIKMLSSIGSSLTGRLLLFDAFRSEWRSLRLPRDPNCSVCHEI